MAGFTSDTTENLLGNDTAIKVESSEKALSKRTIFAYGSGNFASQLSWTMVSTYLIVFYTDVFGLTTASVAMLMLVVKVWDGINDPIMGGIMERTQSRWGRFRPYILFGSPLLLIFTILTFTVPNFSYGGKLIYAYVTYTALSMIYTVINVPYTAMPAVMTRKPGEINRLNAAQMMGMTIGMIALNLCTLPLVKYLGKGVEAAGYQKTASLYAILSLPIFILVFKACKEKVVVSKENQTPLKVGMKAIAMNRHLVSTLAYVLISMIGMFGRIGIAVFYYIYVVGRFDLITIFMMMQMIVGTIIMPFAPRVIEKIGKKNTCILAMVLQALGMVMIFFGNPNNIPYLFISHIVYGLGYISGPCGSGMIVDALDFGELKYGGRPDGTAFALQGLAGKVAGAIGSALGIFMIGSFGYVAGQEITPKIAQGINISVNLVPMVCFLVGIIPLLFYNLSDKKMVDIRAQLAEKASEKA